MKVQLYKPPVQKVEVTLTFLVSGMHSAPTESELYNMLEDVAKDHEGARTYFGTRDYTVILESAAAATKRRV